MMRNPESFKVERAVAQTDGAICYTYRAQNGFGGMDDDVAMSVDGYIMTSALGDDFTLKWGQRCLNATGGKDVTDYANYGATGVVP